MASSSDINMPLRMIEAHNRVIQEASSPKTARRFSQSVFAGLREGFYARTDARAKSRPDALHHVYEWNQVGEASGRLFRLVATGLGTESFTVTYDYLQSTVPVPSGHVFRDKARVMEEGIAVEIRPVNAEVLSFQVDGEQVFTRGPVEIPTPGGENVAGSLRQEFMYYFRPSQLARNPILNGIIKDETDRTIRNLERAKF